MKHKKVKLSAMFLLAFGLSTLNAQTMYVNESNGTQTPYSLSNIEKLYFYSGSLIVKKTDNSNNNYYLNDLQKLCFEEVYNTIETEDRQIINIKIYPNPVNDILTVELPEIIGQTGVIRILNLSGEVLKIRKITNATTIQVDLSDLAQGIYFCNYNNEIEFKTIKIIKE